MLITVLKLLKTSVAAVNQKFVPSQLLQVGLNSNKLSAVTDELSITVW